MGPALIVLVLFPVIAAITAVNVFGNSLAAVVVDGRGNRNQRSAQREQGDFEAAGVATSRASAAAGNRVLPEGDR